MEPGHPIHTPCDWRRIGATAVTNPPELGWNSNTPLSSEALTGRRFDIQIIFGLLFIPVLSGDGSFITGTTKITSYEYIFEISSDDSSTYGALTASEFIKRYGLLLPSNEVIIGTGVVNKIENLIDEIPCISDLRKKFYKTILNKRYDLILKPAYDLINENKFLLEL